MRTRQYFLLALIFLIFAIFLVWPIAQVLRVGFVTMPGGHRVEFMAAPPGSSEEPARTADLTEI